MATEITLEAAIRDATHERPEVRNLAIRNLAPALLDRLAVRAPVVWSRSEHSERARVVATLEHACFDPTSQNAGLAILGLAQLGAPSARERALAGLISTGDDDASVFVRECAVIGLSLLGGAARREGGLQDLVEQIAQDVRPLLDDSRDDVRFQAGPALVETLDMLAEPDLLAALGRERQSEVRHNLIGALSMLDPPSGFTCDKLAEILASPEGEGPIGWDIALALTAARRPEGGPRLVAGLVSRAHRDDALEALAVLGPRAPAEAADAVRKLMSGVLIPVFTRVRAAYAMARIHPDEGTRALDRLGRHVRSAVREAANEARVNLDKLAAEDLRGDGSAYRRG